MAPRRRSPAADGAARGASVMCPSDQAERAHPRKSPNSWQALDHVAEEVTLRLRRERHARHLHRLGARPVYEALIEVADGEDLDDVLARYADLKVEIVEALGGDRFPAAPLHTVDP